MTKSNSYPNTQDLNYNHNNMLFMYMIVEGEKTFWYTLLYTLTTNMAVKSINMVQPGFL